MTDTITRVCNTCFIEKDINMFARDKKSLGGYRVKCKDCDKFRKEIHYIRNRVKYRQAYDDFIERNPDYRKQYYLKNKNIIVQ